MPGYSVVEGKKIFNADVVLENLNLSGVEFRGCALAQFERPLMTRVRSVALKNSKAAGCSIHGVSFDDIVVENLSFSQPLEFAACTFRHVRLAGKIGSFITTPPHYSLSANVVQAFTDAAVSHYQGVDWALDISAAEFSDASIYMVPGNLVKRDRETQFLLKRSAFEAAADSLPPAASVYQERFSLTPFDSFVAIAPVRSKYFKVIHEDLMSLRRLGLAE
ncbi:hypothetical protein ACFRKE_03350 [Kitasatospora indigofera]|uniref:hypothetical protein n=1 Tax=Kitasatospora indigofera TaxID=67307 RepID=UPI00367B5FA8